MIYIRSVTAYEAILCLALAWMIGSCTINVNQHNDAKDNDWKMVKAIEVIIRAEQSYFSRNDRYASLKELGPSGAALLPGDLATGEITGYKFNIDQAGRKFRLRAWPLKWNETGYRSFYVDETFVVREDGNGTLAGPNSRVTP